MLTLFASPANYSTLLGWGQTPALVASLANYSTLLSYCRSARKLLYATWVGPNARLDCFARTLLYATSYCRNARTLLYATRPRPNALRACFARALLYVVSYCRSARALLYAAWARPSARLVCFDRKLLYATFILSRRSRATLRYPEEPESPLLLPSRPPLGPSRKLKINKTHARTWMKLKIGRGHTNARSYKGRERS